MAPGKQPKLCSAQRHHRQSAQYGVAQGSSVGFAKIGEAWEVVIVVSKGATHASIREAAVPALQLRDALNLSDPDSPLLEQLVRAHPGKSYAQLTAAVNAAASWLAMRMINEPANAMIYQREIERLLRTFEMTPDKIAACLEDAKSNVAAGDAPFGEGWPLHRDQVSQTIRRRRKRQPRAKDVEV